MGVSLVLLASSCTFVILTGDRNYITVDKPIRVPVTGGDREYNNADEVKNPPALPWLEK